ncbi:MAG: nuclear transport factor 2 family protein [Chitinophagaceae bacterium]|nr:MAG: nuclear transport factor 2 family protein [Chitinophagaceae bacterium]
MVASCKSEPATKEGASSDIAPIAPDNEQIVKDYFSLFNAHNWTGMAAMYKDSAEFRDPSFGTDIVKQTRQQIADKYAALNKNFPDIADSISHIYPSNASNIIVEFVSKGTAPDSSAFRLPICTIFTIENGLITKDFTYYDNN